MPFVKFTLPEPSNEPERFVIQFANGNATFVLVSRFHDPLAAPPVTLKIRFVPDFVRLVIWGVGWLVMTAMVPAGVVVTVMWAVPCQVACVRVPAVAVAEGARRAARTVGRERAFDSGHEPRYILPFG